MPPDINHGDAMGLVYTVHNMSKNRSAPERGVAFLWKAFLQKTFQVREKILIELMARGRLVAHATISVRMSTIKEYRVPSKASRV